MGASPAGGAIPAGQLALDAEDLDLANRRARVRRKRGAVDVIVWQPGDGPAQLPAGGDPVLRGLRWRDAAPAQAQRADPWCGGRDRDARADGPLGSHFGAVANQVRTSFSRALERYQVERDPARRR